MNLDLILEALNQYRKLTVESNTKGRRLGLDGNVIVPTHGRLPQEGETRVQVIDACIARVVAAGDGCTELATGAMFLSFEGGGAARSEMEICEAGLHAETPQECCAINCTHTALPIAESAASPYPRTSER